jgi:hypothetical protein
LKYTGFIIVVSTLNWRGDKKMSIIFAGVAFVTLFAAWVIIPSILKKRHAAKSGTELEAEE